jgi:NAD(P)-dependent dehydrogenase (short-subunit alcohol dehydrogenase family)
MKDNVAVITGASSGIGRASALAFTAAGWHVVAVGRNENELINLLGETRDLEGTLKIHMADVTETTQVDRLVSETAQQFGRIDALVNAAGIIMTGSVETTTLDDWDKMLNINLRSVFYIMQKCVPHLEETKGNIVNVSSVTGLRAFPGVLAYCVSKAAVDQLTRCTALELAPKGIRVNAVNPGVVVTNLHKRGGMEEADYEKFLEHAKDTHPLGRPGEPDEVADLIFFLASEKAGWITGATYSIDGGRAHTCAR